MGNASVRDALYGLLRIDLSAIVDDKYLAEQPDGDPVGVLPVDASVRQFAAVQLSKSLVKKFQDEIDTESAAARAKAKFLDANDQCRAWQAPKGLSSGSLQGDYELELFGTWLWNFRKFWDSNEFNPWYDRLRDEYNFLSWDDVLTLEKVAFFADVGPGASIAASGCSFLEKFSGNVSFSGKLAPSLWKLKCSNHNYRDLEFFLRLSSDCGFVEVFQNQMSFVPKTVREHRSICIEPSLNMFFEQGVRRLLEWQLIAHYGIDLSNQQMRNSNLALAASLDGRFGTIDLSSASDTIAYSLIKQSVPSDQFSIIDGLRSTKTCLPDGSVVDLQMFSTMGNAFTFPLMTAIFAAVVETAYRFHGLPFKTGYGAKDWAVNGDDIIVRRETYDTVIRLLRLLGFTPNLDKSFNEGFFRESCGVDAYKGHNVRGIYIKTLKQSQDAISALNRLVAWSAEWGIPLPLVCGFIRKFTKKLFLVPMHESDTAGLRVPSTCLPPKKERKWIKLTASAKGWVGQYYHFWRVLPNEAYVPEGSYPNGEDVWPYQFELELEPENEVVSRQSDGGLSPVAVLLSVIKGEIQRGRLVRRANGSVDYAVAEGWTHSWDSIPWVGGPFPNGLVPLSENYVRAYALALVSCGLIH